MKNYLPLISILLIALFFSSCSKSVEQRSEKFFKYHNKENYDAIKSMSIANFEESIVDMSKELYNEYGEIEEFEIYDTDEIPYIADGTKYDDQNKTVVRYKCKTTKENTDVYLRLGFIHEGGDLDADLFMTDMIYSTDKEFIDNYVENF